MNRRIRGIKEGRVDEAKARPALGGNAAYLSALRKQRTRIREWPPIEYNSAGIVSVLRDVMGEGLGIKIRSIGPALLLTQGIGIAVALVLSFYGGIAPFFTILLISLIYANLGRVIVPAFGLLLGSRRREESADNRMFSFRSFAAFALGLMAAFEAGTLVIRAWIVPGFLPFAPFFSRGHVAILLLNAGVAALLVFLIDLYRSLRRRLALRDRQYVELENLQMKTRLMMLQARLNPHFLFNTLNVILDLAAQAPEKIETVVLNLSDIYRSILDRSESAWSTLGEELDLVRKYLEIESLRMGPRLSFRLEADPSLADVPLPPLLLEPLVENAVLHGVGPKKDGGRILVRVEAEGDHIVIGIADDGVGMAEAPREGGFGLTSVRERLHLLYGSRGRLAVEKAPGGGTRVRLEVPYAP
jgi:signal transduction histidine kinase